MQREPHAGPVHIDDPYPLPLRDPPLRETPSLPPSHNYTSIGGVIAAKIAGENGRSTTRVWHGRLFMRSRRGRSDRSCRSPISHGRMGSISCAWRGRALQLVAALLSHAIVATAWPLICACKQSREIAAYILKNCSSGSSKAFSCEGCPLNAILLSLGAFLAAPRGCLPAKPRKWQY